MKTPIIFFKIFIALLLNINLCFAMSKTDNPYVVNEFINDEHYVLRYWKPNPKRGSAYGHISLETQKYYLSFWPEGTPNTKECLDKNRILYCNIICRQCYHCYHKYVNE